MRLEILEAGEPRTKAVLRELAGRATRLEQLDSEAAREKTVAVFGAPLPPGEVVARIVEDVRRGGDEALFDYARKLDGVRLGPENLWVAEVELAAAAHGCPGTLREALGAAAARIRDFQRRLLPAPLPLADDGSGVRLGLKITPVRSAGVYIPGGLAAYPSSVLMNVVPAQVAGVEEIILATPPTADGSVNAGVLAAAEVVGCRRILRAGGAQAIAALAFGTASVPKVDKIVGPGNLFVMLAKRAVFGVVDIDLLAGPSEVLIIADASAEPRFVAADMIAQAEHDPMASALLLTDSRLLAERVCTELERQTRNAERRRIIAESLGRYGRLIVCRSLAECCALANEIAPEHLEIMTKCPQYTAELVRHAGAIFLGPHTPEALGDYAAGPSHTLPTGGTARFFSGLSCLSFLKHASLVQCVPEAHRKLRGIIRELAAAEGLFGHRRASEIRFEP